MDVASGRPDGIDSRCPLPWVNLSIDVDGSTRPCCKFAHLHPDSDYQLANLRDTDLRGAWNGEAMQRLRRDLAAGRRPLECRTCWDEEAAGIASWRQTFLSDRRLAVEVDYCDPTPPQPVGLDLKLSNTCNLRCRICGPVASSSWLAEVLADEGEAAAPDLLANRAYFKSAKLVERAADLGALQEWAEGIRHVELTGGEPMLSLENRRLVALLAQEGRPERIGLHLTTNATVIDEQTTRWFPRFDHVNVVLSVDDIGRRLEYQRAPADWGVVRDTIARWPEVEGVDVVAFNCSVSLFNVWDLSEALDWFSSEHPGLGVHLNLVHGPAHLSVRAVPPPLRGELLARLSAYADDPARPHDLRVQVAQLATFVTGGPDDRTLWDAAMVDIAHRDEVRGERFADVYPDLWAAAGRAGLGAPSAGGAPVDPGSPVGPVRRRRWLRR